MGITWAYFMWDGKIPAVSERSIILLQNGERRDERECNKHNGIGSSLHVDLTVNKRLLILIMVGNEKVENKYIGLDIGGMQGRGRVSIIDDVFM